MQIAYHLTFKQSVRRFGGIRKMRSALGKIAKRHGVGIEACHQFNEEEPEDMRQDWLNIIFSFKGDSRNCDRFGKAMEDVIDALAAKGMQIEYECNGDAGSDILMSYKVVGG